MESEKKQSTKIGVKKECSSNDPMESNGRMAPVTPNYIQSADSFEIKRESDIKQEPVSVGELVDVSVSTHRIAVRVPGFDERDAEYDFDDLSWDEAKAEVKNECDKKKEEKAKTSADNGKQVMDDQQDQQPPSQNRKDLRTPESGNEAHSTQQRGGKALVSTSKPHKCEFCEYSAQYKWCLNRHMLKHTGEKPHGCTLCPKRFTIKQSLRGHMKVHVEEFLFHCWGCLQGFDGKEEKTEHEANCKVVRYECYLCKDSFGSLKSQMVKHMRVHSGDKPFECKECPRKFSRIDHLKAHMYTHTTKLPFKCLVCRRGFLKNDKRKAHQRTCNGRNYECYLCKKFPGSSKAYRLKGHMHTHSGEKIFRHRSRKTLTLKSSLNRHMKNIHNKQY